ADADRIELPDEVALQLAQHVRSNVRELEGSLVRVSTFAALKNVPLTRDFVCEALGVSSASAQAAPISIESVQKAVASHFSVRIADLKGPRRHQGISRPRMIAMYLSRKLTGASFPEIGLRFGGKAHSTVINACKRIESIQTEDSDLRATVAALHHRLAGEPGQASAHA